MRPGDEIVILALKSDGTVYRRWRARVESVARDHIVTINRIGDRVEDIERSWSHRQHSRNFYWFDRPYNLAEVYEQDGRLKQLYVHIASPAVLRDRTLEYTDHELDVVKRGRKPPRVVDREEFAAAIVAYGYSPAFQEACWRAVSQAMRLIKSWKASGTPYGARTVTPATDSRMRRTEV